MEDEELCLPLVVRDSWPVEAILEVPPASQGPWEADHASEVVEFGGKANGFFGIPKKI